MLTLWGTLKTSSKAFVLQEQMFLASETPLGYTHDVKGFEARSFSKGTSNSIVCLKDGFYVEKHSHLVIQLSVS